ncbi:MAG TPA: 4-hydroxythreonine-4-phosphate dehydrogenase PdxA [Longimicrobiales bacterium]
MPGGPRVAFTLGDPRGIGPEVVSAAVAAALADSPDLSVLLVGPAGFDPCAGPYREVGAWDGTEAGAGKVAVAAITMAVELALGGQVDAVVTGPIHKPALHAAGYAFPGHTELLQELTGAPRVGMLMAAEETASRGPLRVLLATTHVALRDVPRLVTSELLVEQTRLLDRALRSGWEIAEPRIALCALNPHASDRGLFGDEEGRVLEPAVHLLREAGVAATGPIPADTVFTRALSGEFDAVVAPYHDVGMAAFKTASFGRGVNVTLGLPFVRTSPDHGTAFDLAGTGRADPTSTKEALRLAIRLSSRLARARHGA